MLNFAPRARLGVPIDQRHERTANRTPVRGPT